MQAYKLVVPEGVAPGDVLWVTVDPKTQTASCVHDDEVKATHLTQTNHLTGIVRPVTLRETLGPQPERWPAVVRYISEHRYGKAIVRFIDYERNPMAFITSGGVYSEDKIPPEIKASTKVHYAAFFAPKGVGHEAALSAFYAATTGWRRLGHVQTMGRLFFLCWTEADVCPAVALAMENTHWMKWSESFCLRSGRLYDVCSFCAHQASRFRISVRKDEKGRPVAVFITTDQTSTDAVTVYPEPDSEEKQLLTYTPQ